MVFIGTRKSRSAEDESTSPLETRTRSRVLQTVSVDGPVTAAELGRRLELTPAAVRRHLDALVERHLVVAHEPAVVQGRGRGRPARAYVVSEAGHAELEAGYDSLAVEVLRYLSAHAGPDAVADFARTRTAVVEQRYAAALAAAGNDTTTRAQALVGVLTEDGFAATARPVSTGTSTGTRTATQLTGIQLCQGHCPVQHVAEEFPAFCEAETEAFSRLLGVHVQRLATLARGHHVCTTFVPTGGIGARARKSEPAAGVVAADRHAGIIADIPDDVSADIPDDVSTALPTDPTAQHLPLAPHVTKIEEGSPS